MEAKWEERASKVSFKHGDNSGTGCVRTMANKSAKRKKVAAEAAEGLDVELPKEKVWALYDKLRWNSNSHVTWQAWGSWSRILTIRSLTLSQCLRMDVIPPTDKCRYHLLIAQCNCLLFRRCVTMVTDDLCCQECGVLLSKATANFVELVEVLARKCRVTSIHKHL